MRATLTPERNHRTLELYALLLAALAVPGLDGDGGLRRFALAELDRNLARGLPRRRRPPRGVEPLPHGRPALVHRACARTRAGSASRCRTGSRSGSRAPARSRATATARTGGSRRSRTPTPAGYPELLALADELLGPAGDPRASFPDGGYHVQRSGWDADARYGVFDCGPLGDGGHGHYDLLSVELFAGGRPLIVDPGRGTYSEAPPNLRRWFRGTAAHNTVCVDGLDQTPYTRTRPRGPVAEGRFLGRATAHGRDALDGRGAQPGLRRRAPAPGHDRTAPAG